MSDLELILTVAGLVLTTVGFGAGFFGAGFAVGRSRGKTEAYADIAAKRKAKKDKRDRPASTESDEEGEDGVTTPPERETGTQP